MEQITTYDATTINDKYMRRLASKPETAIANYEVASVTVNAETLQITHHGGLRYGIQIDGVEMQKVRKLTLILEAGEAPVCQLEVIV
jgi:hypothetical protein